VRRASIGLVLDCADPEVLAWESAGFPVGRVRLVAAAEMAGPILDIRQDSEFEAGHVTGARHVELGALAEAAGELDAQPLTVMCGHGERAMTGDHRRHRRWRRHPEMASWVVARASSCRPSRSSGIPRLPREVTRSAWWAAGRSVFLAP
jgi:hypothetical protein